MLLIALIIWLVVWTDGDALAIFIFFGWVPFLFLGAFVIIVGGFDLVFGTEHVWNTLKVVHVFLWPMPELFWFVID